MYGVGPGGGADPPLARSANVCVDGSCTGFTDEVGLNTRCSFTQQRCQTVCKDTHSNVGCCRPQPRAHAITSALGDLQVPNMLTHSVDEVVFAQNERVRPFRTEDALACSVGKEGR